MKKILPTSYFAAIAITFAFTFFTLSFARAQERQITLTGFTEDVIADAVLSTTPTSLTTTSIDLPTGTGDVFFEDGYSNNTVPLSNGLPASGQFTSSDGHTFQLAPYNSNNDLRLEALQTGTLTFSATDQVPYSDLFVLATAGNGPVNLNYVINFSDATTATGVISVDDWFCVNCIPYAIRDLTRIDRAGGDPDGSNQFAIREFAIALDAGDQAKQITSIDFLVPLGETGVANIFGVTGIALSVAPVTLEYFSAKVEKGNAILQWKTSQELNNKRFIVERASSAQPTVFVSVGEVQATTSANGTTYNFSNTPPVSGTYLYRLTQEDIDGHKKIIGIKSVNISNKVKWIVQDLGSQWRIICDQPFTYRLLDIDGRLLKASNSSGSTTISKPAQHGIYQVQVETGGESSTQKIIK